MLVPFPFDDLSSSKLRPALCLTNPIGRHRNVVMAFITSRVPDDPEDSDLVIDPESEEGEGSGLKRRSALRLHKMVTLKTDVVVRQLGDLPEALEPRVTEKLAGLFSLPTGSPTDAQAEAPAEAPTADRTGDAAEAQPADVASESPGEGTPPA